MSTTSVNLSLTLAEGTDGAGLTSTQLRSFFSGYTKELLGNGCDAARLLEAMEGVVIELGSAQGLRCGEVLYDLAKQWHKEQKEHE